MLKIYDVYTYVSIDGAEWCEVSDLFTDAHRVSDKELIDETPLNNASFSEAYEYLLAHNSFPLRAEITLFSHKPQISIRYCGTCDWAHYKKFSTLSLKIEFRENKYVTLDWIMRHLSADQCIQYMKERGMTACPILKGE